MQMKVLLIAILATSVLTYPSISTNQISQCLVEVKGIFSKFEKALEQNTPNSIVDGITQTVHYVPNMLLACFGKAVEKQFSKQLPPICITDLGRATKILIRMANQTQNQFKFSIDAALFEKLYQNKLKKQCPVLKDLSMENLKSGGVCMEASYKLSLLVQQLTQDTRKGDKKAALTDFDAIISSLPDVLDACGQSKWADQIRKYFPMNCVHALQDFGVELEQVEHNYFHFEWLVAHYKQVQGSFNNVRHNCPIFQMMK